jgi:hypothetical protein
MRGGKPGFFPSFQVSDGKWLGLGLGLGLGASSLPSRSVMASGASSSSKHARLPSPPPHLHLHHHLHLHLHLHLHPTLLPRLSPRAPHYHGRRRAVPSPDPDPDPNQETSGSKPSIHPMPLDLFDPFGLSKKATPEKKQKVSRHS